MDQICLDPQDKLPLHPTPLGHIVNKTPSPHQTKKCLRPPLRIISGTALSCMLNGLKPHKATGSDGIKPRVLKELSDVIAPILTAMFHYSLNTGNISSDWKQANVAPIFKKGGKHKAPNYPHPVSLTCICKQVVGTCHNKQPHEPLETKKI